MGTQIIIFGGLRSQDGEEGPTDTTGIETEVLDFETGESRTIAPLLSQDKFSHGIALYFVDNAKFCVIEDTDQTSSVPTSTESPADGGTAGDGTAGGGTAGGGTAGGGTAGGGTAGAGSAGGGSTGGF